jgi:hypothetical protein
LSDQLAEQVREFGPPFPIFEAVHVGEGTGMSTKTTRGEERADHFNDPSVYMLRRPKARPRIAGWLMFAVVAGAILAIAILIFESFSMQFQF